MTEGRLSLSSSSSTADRHGCQHQNTQEKSNISFHILALLGFFPHFAGRFDRVVRFIGSPTRQGESPLCPRVGSLRSAYAGEQILFPQKPLAVAAPLTELDRARIVRTAAAWAFIFL